MGINDNEKDFVNLFSASEILSKDSEKNIDSFYRSIFEEMPSYVTVQNKKLQIVAANKIFRTDFGNGNGIGEYCYEIYKHRLSPCIKCPVSLTFQDGKSHSTEEVVTTKSGNHRNIMTWTSPIYNRDKQIILVTEMSTDISDIRRFQDRLTSLGLMISSMSHSIRGMLTAADGGLYKIKKSFKKNNINKAYEAFIQIEQTFSRIRKTVLEILYYTKLREFKYQTVDIQKLISNLISDFQEKAIRNQILLKINCVGPTGNDFFEFEADYTWFYTSLSNFIENSIDACITDTSKKHHLITIDITKINSEWAEILICDNGSGMSREVKDKMFTLFFSSKGSKGTGLGLFIANQIIEQHNGKVDVKTSQGKGCLVKIGFPIKHKSIE